MSEEKRVGIVTHYFGHLNVAVIKLEDDLKVGDTIRIKGHTSDFTQPVGSMEVDRKKIAEGRSGDEIALRVTEHARQHDEVFKVTDGGAG